MSTNKSLKSETLAPAWTFQGKHGVLTEPLVVAGDRLIGVAGSTIFAVDLHTGQSIATPNPQPKKSWPYSVSYDGGGAQVTAAGGVVYFMDDDKLMARRLADGTALPGWTPQPLDDVSNLFAKDGRLIAVHLDGRGGTLVSGYDTVTGKKAFGPIKISSLRSGRLAYGGGALFFVASGKLNAVNVDFGDVRWQIAVPGDTLSSAVAPLVAGDVVVVPGGSLHGIDIVTGRVKWSVRASTNAATNWATPAAYQPVPAVAATIAASQRATLPTAALPNPAAAVAAASAAGITVATNAVGDVMGISLLDGNVVWKMKAEKPGAPSIIESTVFVTIEGGKLLAHYDLYTGTSRGTPYALPGLSTRQQPVIGNGAIHLVDDRGNITARPFSSQQAAYFDGSYSRIDVKADDAQFDFGVEDFTVESWFRSSRGGEVVSSYPTKDLNGHGFRLNVASDGQIRVAITNANGSVAVRGRTRPTNAADGEWHHVALIRRDGAFILLLDGLALPVLLPAGSVGNVAVGGTCALTIGAYISAPNGRATEHFCGLIREVRIWDRALDIATITTNLTVALTGMEPRLRGLWRLDDVQKPNAPIEPRNAVLRHRATAQFLNAASRSTDLIMNRSAFPYLLHEAEGQWPYPGTWAARGESAVIGPPAVSTDGVVAFATNNAIYAVGSHDGKRIWSMDVGITASNPISDGSGFIMMTEDESLFRLDSRTGAKVQLKGFEKMPLERGVQVVDPAVSGKYLVAATASGTIMIVSRIDDGAKSVKIGGPVVQLALSNVGLLALSGSPTARKLNLIDPATATLRSTIALQSDAFCTADNWVFCVQNRMVVRMDSANLSLNGVLGTSAAIPGKITGLIASADEDLLVAVTDGGEVYGLTLGQLSTTWKTTLPLHRAGVSTAINPPVLDQDRRIVCTTRGGSVALLDPETGALNGLYFTDRGAVGTPAVAAGTLFTGCDDAPQNDAAADLDGALHSVVFGETMALRLNLDAKGVPVPNGTQHVMIDADTEDCTLYLMGVHESCIEAWVNIPVLTPQYAARGGGGILSICPARNSGFDINLWIEPDGTLHYTSRAQEDDGRWVGLHAQASTTIIDGDWHHIAVSRMLPLGTAPAGSPDRVVLYIDGQPVRTTAGPAPTAPVASAIGLKAFIGANASDTLAATRPFVGMIGEVRVWDTYMVSTEIVSRMHVKLRGDEPDLLAYWNFDYEAAHDSARQGHDGRVIGHNSTIPNWWLTDLPFTQPAYPFVTTAAAITAQSAGKSTTYSLTVKVCRADGSGMADQDVRLWYVKYDANDPASIIVNAKSLSGIASSTGGGATDDGKMYVGKTASDGTLKLTIGTPLPGHGPSLDMWTAFMPANERFHVNVLIDNQQLSKPAPPSLTAQAKLIQDYHYTTGNKIDDTRDRSTWRVVLRASDSNNVPCPREPISVWADAATTIEVGGKSYPINQHNPANLTAETNGELTLVLAADGLVAPALYARAGFMHRNDRIVISPDQDAHTTLSTMKSEDLTQERVTNWKKNPGSNDKKSLLSKEQHEHAPKIAEAVRHVTSSVKQSEPDKPLLKSGRPSPARMKLMQMRTGIRPTAADGLLRSDTIPHDALLLDEMKQPEAVPADDQVILMRTMEGTPRQAPVNPEALRKSLKGNLGFVFERKPTGLRYEMLKTKAQADSERGRATLRAAGPVAALSLEGQLLGSFWDDIVDFATDVYNGAVKIVVTIAEQVEIAIHKMVDGITNIVHTVVNTVQDALNAVVGFFDQLMVGIKKLIEFLRVLFDWQEILRTHDILHDTFLAVFDVTTHSLRNTDRFTNAIATLAGKKPPPVPPDMENLNTSAKAAGDQVPADAQANSVQGKSMTQRVATTPARSTQYSGPAEPSAATADAAMPIDILARELPALFSDILDLSPSTLVARLESIATKIASGGLVAAGQLVAATMNGMADVISWTVKVLDAKIDIPFISELYKWITGKDLTILDVACLAMAVPVNLAYAVITLLQGGARPFAPDAKNLARDLRVAAGLLPRANTPMLEGAGNALLQAEPVPDTPHAPEIAFIVTRTITVVADLVGDMAFIETTVKQDVPIGTELANGLGWIQGIWGIASISLQTFSCQKNYEARLIAVLGPDKAKDFLPPHVAITYTIYGIQMLLRVVKTKGAISSMLGIGGGPGIFDSLTALKDKHELRVTFVIGVLTFPLLGYMIGSMVDRKPVLAARGNDNVTTEYVLLTTRDILGIIPIMFEWMFTKGGAKEIKRVVPGGAEMIYDGVYLVRHVSQIASIVLHGVAVFKYGD